MAIAVFQPAANFCHKIFDREVKTMSARVLVLNDYVGTCPRSQRLCQNVSEYSTTKSARVRAVNDYVVVSTMYFGCTAQQSVYRDSQHISIFTMYCSYDKYDVANVEKNKYSLFDVSKVRCKVKVSLHRKKKLKGRIFVLNLA